MQIFSIKEQQLIENEILKAKNTKTFGILLCFYTGVRLGELCALKWNNIDLDTNMMSITGTANRIKNFGEDMKKTMLIVGSPKSHSSVRKIPLPDFLIKMIRDFIDCKKDENHFILSGSDTPIDPRTYQRLYKSILKSAGGQRTEISLHPPHLCHPLLWKWGWISKR